MIKTSRQHQSVSAVRKLPLRTPSRANGRQQLLPEVSQTVMAFQTSVLKRYGWPAHSVVEDLEFVAQMLLDGICVHNPDAIIGAEMAATRKQAETQRRRWEGGRFEIFGKYAPALLGRYLTQWRFCYFDRFMDLLIPPLSALVLALTALLVASLWLSPFLSLPLGLALTGVAFYVASGMFETVGRPGRSPDCGRQ